MSRSGGRALAVTIVALALAVLAWGSALDRLSATRSGAAALVPAPLRSNAWLMDGAGALQQGRTGAALASAERAVLADPIDVRAVSLLATARYLHGDAQGAAAAFRVAARLGWRDQPTQLYWFEAASASGEHGMAAQRLDALLRQEPQLAQRQLAFATLEATASGRRALAERVAAGAPWLPAYFGDLAGLTSQQLAARALVLDEPALRSISLTCEGVAPLVQALAAAGRSDAQPRWWREHCASKGLVLDSDFAAARLAGAAAAGWEFVGEGGLDLRLEPDADRRGQSVVIDSSLPQTTVFVVQSRALTPGRYRLGWQAQDEAAKPSRRIVARLGCHRGQGPFLSSGGVAVIADACPQQWLELAITPGDGAVKLDRVSLAALTN